MVFARISLEWNKSVSCLSIYAFIASFLVKEVIKYIFIESSHFYDSHDEWFKIMFILYKHGLFYL